MGAIKKALKESISDYDAQNFTNVQGTIIGWNDIMQTAQVKYWNPKSDTYVTCGGVKVAQNNGGVTNSGIKVGQNCIISFQKNNLFKPIIMGVTDNYYQANTNTDQGAFIVDDEVYKIKTEEHLVPLNLSWINDTSNIDAYNNSLGNYTDVDIEEEAIDMCRRIDKYEKDETGLINQKSKAGIKLRNNGDIDIFTSNNIGLRISNTGNIKFYAKDVEYTNLLDIDPEQIDKSLTEDKKYYVANIMNVCTVHSIIQDIEDTLSQINESLEQLKEYEKTTEFDNTVTDSKEKAYEDLKEEFYALLLDDETIPEYVNKFQGYYDFYYDQLVQMQNQLASYTVEEDNDDELKDEIELLKEKLQELETNMENLQSETEALKNQTEYSTIQMYNDEEEEYPSLTKNIENTNTNISKTKTLTPLSTNNMNYNNNSNTRIKNYTGVNPLNIDTSKLLITKASDSSTAKKISNR